MVLTVYDRSCYYRPVNAGAHSTHSVARPVSERASQPVPLSTRLLRLRFALLSRVAPRRAERAAARLFMTPRPRPPVPMPDVGVPARELEVTVAGSPVAGWSWGSAVAPAVLLVHGWSGLAADMAPLAGALARAGLRAVAFDLPAHGRTPGRRTSLGEWMRVLPSLTERCGGVQGVVGHSLGAAAVTLALAAGLDAPRAVLVAPPLGPPYFLARVQRFIGLPAERVAGMERELVAAVGRPIEFFDAARAAASLAQPALVFHDPADSEVPYAHGEAIARAWRGSRLVTMEGAGHFRILSSPEVARQTVEFLLG
jgi:pimeloyl-ACP methyl ester carboxylesterase